MYIAGESMSAVSNSPFMEKATSRGKANYLAPAVRFPCTRKVLKNTGLFEAFLKAFLKALSGLCLQEVKKLLLHLGEKQREKKGENERLQAA